MAARLCVEKPPPRTLGDDLESFALVLLWLVGRYAANAMSPVERAMFLQRFDSLYGDPKADMFRSGRALVPTLKLPSQNLRYLLEDLLDGYRFRYTELGEREQQKPGQLEAHKDHQARLENHQWLMHLLSDALKAEEWKRLRDPVRKEQDVAPLFPREEGRKRKSACSEYELTNANKRPRLGEHGRNEEDTEEHGDKESDEGDEDEYEEDLEETGDEQDSDGDDEYGGC
jgi:hypothetical protein